jgi:hypothetical protein
MIMSATFKMSGPRGHVEFKGVLLGETTSHQDEHFNHPRDYARKGERCYACRWSEYQLFRVHEFIVPKTYEGRYLVTSFGQTIVPGENVYRRIDPTDSPAEVIELLTTRKFGQQPVITSSAARLLARASDLDPAIQEAWDNRVVL